MVLGFITIPGIMGTTTTITILMDFRSATIPGMAGLSDLVLDLLMVGGVMDTGDITRTGVLHFIGHHITVLAIDLDLPHIFTGGTDPESVLISDLLSYLPGQDRVFVRDNQPLGPMYLVQDPVQDQKQGRVHARRPGRHPDQKQDRVLARRPDLRPDQTYQVQDLQPGHKRDLVRQ